MSKADRQAFPWIDQQVASAIRDEKCFRNEGHRQQDGRRRIGEELGEDCPGPRERLRAQRRQEIPSGGNGRDWYWRPSSQEELGDDPQRPFPDALVRERRPRRHALGAAAQRPYRPLDFREPQRRSFLAEGTRWERHDLRHQLTRAGADLAHWRRPGPPLLPGPDKHPERQTGRVEDDGERVAVGQLRLRHDDGARRASPRASRVAASMSSDFDEQLNEVVASGGDAGQTPPSMPLLVAGLDAR